MIFMFSFIFIVVYKQNIIIDRLLNNNEESTKRKIGGANDTIA